MECIPRSRHRSGPNRLWSLLAITIITITLAACGTSKKPGPTPDPVEPARTVISPLVAQRGDTVTISGSNFGSTKRSVLVGGSPAIIGSWTDTKITVTVGSGTPNGPQEVVVQRKDAAETVPGFFVGVAYSGAATGLQAFADSLEGDTAVLLDAKTYPLGAAGLKLDRISLYGQGEGKTILSTTAAPAGLQLLAGHNETLVLADLSVSTDSLLISNSLSIDSLTVQALNGDEAAQPARQASLGPVIAALQLARQQGGNPAASAAADAGSGSAGAELNALSAGSADAEAQAALPEALDAHVLLRNVTFSELSGGGIGTSQPTDVQQMLFAGSLRFENATVNMPGSVFSLFSSGHIGFVDSSVAAGAVEAVSLRGAVSMAASKVTASGSKAGLLGDTGILLLNAADVQVTAESQLGSSGNIELLAGAFEGLAGTSAAGRLLISDSGLSAGSGQPAGAGSGEVVLITDNAALSVSSSKFSADSSLVIVALDAATAITDSQVSLGAAGTDVAEFFVQTYGDLLLQGSTVTAISNDLSVFGIDAFAQACALNDNTFELLGNGADGQTDAAEVWFSCSGPAADEPASATLTGNRFLLQQAGLANVDLGVNLGSLTGSGNTVLGAGVMLFSSEPDDTITFSNNEISAAGSLQGIGLTAVGTVTLDGNTVKGGSGEATALYVITWDQLLLSAKDNTFTDFTQALYFKDESGAALAGLKATVTGNDFLFDINQAPQVAWLESLAAGTVIDAAGNRWGMNDDVQALADFVWQNDTTAGITLAPLKVATP
jgi:hypothetical protein